MLDQREAGHQVLRWYYQTSTAKQYVRATSISDDIPRTDTCSDARHFAVRRGLGHIALVEEELAATNKRAHHEQAE